MGRVEDEITVCTGEAIVSLGLRGAVLFLRPQCLDLTFELSKEGGELLHYRLIRDEVWAVCGRGRVPTLAEVQESSPQGFGRRYHPSLSPYFTVWHLGEMGWLLQDGTQVSGGQSLQLDKTLARTAGGLQGAQQAWRYAGTPQPQAVFYGDRTFAIENLPDLLIPCLGGTGSMSKL